MRATERLRLDPGEHRAISVLTTDPCLVAQPWVPCLVRIHLSLECVAANELPRLAPASDVVLLPATHDAAAAVQCLVEEVVASCATPILIAVERGCEAAAAQAIDAGAASYLFLPYMRTSVVRQIRHLADQSPRASGDAVLQAGRVRMDVRRREVMIDGLVAPMPPREFEVLRMLLQRAGEVVLKKDIVARLWPDGKDGSQSLSVHVRRLRERLEHDPSRPTLLRTVRNAGYRLDAEGHGADQRGEGAQVR